MYWAGSPERKERVLRSLGWFAMVVVSIGLWTPEAHGTHFRFGTFNSQPTGNAREVVFQMVNSFRRDAFTGTHPDGKPRIGDVITEIVGATTFFFGDGQSTPTLQYRVTALSVEENWIVGEALQPGTTTAGLRHTYAGPGPYLNVGINSCCRLSTLNNRFEDNYILDGRVTTQDGNRSPVAALVPIVAVNASSAESFQAPAVDPDGDRLRWRLSSAAEAGGGEHPPGLTVNPDTGLVTWNTATLDTVNFWTAQIVIEDLDALGRVKSKTPVDFLLRIAGAPPGTDPVGTIDPPGPFEVAVNTPVSFTIRGTDADAGAVVTLNSGGLPAGATTTPSLPTSGPSGVSATFHWTPTALGSYQIVFSATDNSGRQQLFPVTIVVRTAADLAISKTATPEAVKVSSNLTYSIIVSNHGPSEASAVLVTDTLPPGVTFVSAASSQGSCAEASGVVTCALGTMATGAGASIAIVVTANAAGAITNVATVSSTSPDPDPSNNEATVVTAVEETNAGPTADASATDIAVIAPNNVGTTVRLDASKSFDPDGDALTYHWFEGTRALGTAVKTDVFLHNGLHRIDLVVSDGLATDTDTIEVLVISPCDAMALLMAKVEAANLGKKISRPLNAHLKSARRAFGCGGDSGDNDDDGDHDDFASSDDDDDGGGHTAKKAFKSIRHLQAFQQKVRAKVRDPATATVLIQCAQDILHAVSAPYY